MLFSSTNNAKLQLLDNELSISQQNLTVSQYFSRVKVLYEKILKLDLDGKISKIKMRQIIIHGLHPECNSLITTACGWAKEPTLLKLENILAKQEAIDKKLSSISIKF